MLNVFGRAALVGVLLAATSASAGVTLVTTQTNDAAFENVGGFLQTYYGLPNPASGSTVLPPLERAVGQVKAGTNKRRGLYVPNASTGIPGVGNGVTQALTNFGAVGIPTDTNFGNGTPVAFSIGRTGTTVTYTVGGETWSDTQSYYADINGFELRLRSNTPTNSYSADSLGVTNLVYHDATTANQLLGSPSAADGAVLIDLWSGAAGNFTVTGNYVFAWTGTQPTGAALASQIKLLALPPIPGTVPEPAGWALMIVGFGCSGAALRRRRASALSPAR